MSYPRCTTNFFVESCVFHVDHVTTDTWAAVEVPKNTRRLVISGDYLDELVIPNGVESCVCCGLGLRKLVVPDSVAFLYCNRNNLRSLELPHGLYICDISDNPLYHLTFRNENNQELELGRIQMKRVRLTRFDAKVKENCEIDMDENPQLVSYSREVEYAVFMYPYKGKPFYDDSKY